MNARTGEIALDVAFTKFGGEAPVALVLSYNGPALPTREQAAEWNRPLLLGFESSTTRAYAGGDAGETDSGFSCFAFDQWGYPRDCGSWCCAADTPNTSPQFVPNIEEYGYRYALRQIVGGRLGPITWYGNPTAVEAACAGTRRAGLVAIRWGVGTWGYGESGSGAPPAESNCELLQSGNNPGPRPATDLDWLYAPVALFRAMGGPAGGGAPAAPANRGSSMEIVHYNNPFGLTAVLTDDGLELQRWNVPPEQNTLGVPQPAWDWWQAGGRGSVDVIQLDGATALRWEANLKLRTDAFNGAEAPEPGEGGGLTADQVATINGAAAQLDQAASGASAAAVALRALVPA